MTKSPKIAFVGAGSTVFMKNIVGDVLQREALAGAHIALMDIDKTRLGESELVVDKLIRMLGTGATYSTHTDLRPALDGADFVITTFQIGGYDRTIDDFEVPKEFGLRQTIADTMGVGGIMRGLRTVPHLWNICQTMTEVCPDAQLLQYVNPMAINTWAIARRFPKIRQVGLCHSVQGTAKLLAKDLGLDIADIRYRCAGINHIAFYLNFEHRQPDGSYRDLYPDLQAGYAEGRLPVTREMERCENRVRYEMLKRTGYYVTESSEHFAEYTPWFIKRDRPDLLETFRIPLDEYPQRLRDNKARWAAQLEELRNSETMDLGKSNEYASSIINSIWTDTPSVIYGNVRNDGLITNLPEGCAVEVPCLVDSNGIQPTVIGDLPPQLAAIMRSNVNVQELVVEALMTGNREHVYHAAMMDPHTAAELDLDQIWRLMDRMIETNAQWLPDWLGAEARKAVA
ncbi:alpha-galactosidase [Halovulum sp. GXIMD14794]